MHNFKKALLSSISFLVCVAFISGVFLGVFFRSEVAPYDDTSTRAKLAGEIDFIFCGASHGQSAFVPDIADSILDCTSYNLSGAMMPIHGRKVLIEKEVERNPVDTVVLEISLETLERDESGIDSVEGDAYVLSRLDSFSERLQYTASYIPKKHWDYTYSISMLFGFSQLKSIITNAARIELDRGYVSHGSKDVSIPDEMISELHNSERIRMPLEENINEIKQIIDFCKEQNVDIIIVFTPLSDSVLWKIYGEDEVYSYFKEFCEDNNCSLINFDLLKSRFEHFNDTNSFSDGYHLSKEGATAFSPVFSDTISKFQTGEDISGLFYSNYAEMEQYSPYN